VRGWRWHWLTGPAHPGDTIKWVASYQNNTSQNASVNLTDPLTSADTRWVSVNFPTPTSITLATPSGDGYSLAGCGLRRR
jgi:hypothetical protein